VSEPETDFRTLQYNLSAHIRAPASNPAPPGIEDRRVGVYRDLMYRNVEGFMANSFPVLRSIIEDADWHLLMRRYFALHQARTPLFPKLPQEFLHYLDDHPTAHCELVFLRELAHYEWLELEVSLDKREINDQIIGVGVDCLDGVPLINPLARVRAYRFPVHRISPTYQPETAPDEPTYLAVYRDRQDEVGFMQLNSITARLVDLVLQDKNVTGRDLLMQISDELRHPDVSIVIAGGKDIFDELVRRDVLLGAQVVA
jgi:hypothetical protein